MKTIELENLVFEVVPKPLETLTKKQLEEYKSASVPVARDGFGFEGITESDIELHVLKSNTTVFAREKKTNEIIGFSSSDVINIDNVPVVYLQGTALSKSGQGRGIYNLFNSLRLINEMDELGLRTAYVSTRTQSPLVVKNMIRKLELFPRPGIETPADVKLLAKNLAQVLFDHHSDFKHPEGLQFDEDALVSRMAYGRIDENGNPQGVCMYGSVPWVENDDEVNQFLKSFVDFENGDALILMGKVNYELVKDLLNYSLSK